MDTSKKQYLYKLIYNQNNKNAINEIKKITDSKLLHILASIYNWDNGFDIPYSIINNKNCDLGTALMIFYDADGYRALENRDELKNPNLKKWANFVLELEDKILNNKFKIHNIKFEPSLTKVQIYKLKKNNPNIPKIFIEESEGNIIEIPNL